MAQSLWFKDGKLLFDADGKLIFCEDCPCDDCCPCLVSCVDNRAPEFMRVTISGVEVGSCGDDCNDFNQDHLLPYYPQDDQPNHCIWWGKSPGSGTFPPPSIGVSGQPQEVSTIPCGMAIFLRIVNQTFLDPPRVQINLGVNTTSSLPIYFEKITFVVPVDCSDIGEIPLSFVGGSPPCGLGLGVTVSVSV